MAAIIYKLDKKPPKLTYHNSEETDNPVEIKLQKTYGKIEKKVLGKKRDIRTTVFIPLEKEDKIQLNTFPKLIQMLEKNQKKGKRPIILPKSHVEVEKT